MNKKIKKRILHISVFMIALILFLGIILVGLNSDLLSPTKTEISENVDINFDSSGVYNWTPKEKGKILSIKIFGEIEGGGEGKIFIEGIQIFGEPENKTKDNLISGKFTEFLNIQSVNETNETIIENSTIDNETIVENSTNSTVVENITNSTNSTIENITNSTIVENVTSENSTDTETNDDYEDESNDDEDESDDDEDESNDDEENVVETKKVETKTVVQSVKSVVVPIKSEEKIIERPRVAIESQCDGLCKLKKIPKKDFYELIIKISDGSIIKIKKIVYEIILE